MKTWWTALGLGMVVIFMIIYFAAAPKTMPPLGENAYAGKAVNNYGEAASRGKVKEPVCFWSASAFVIVGLAVFLWMDLSSPLEARSLMSVASFYSVPLAALMVWLGPGSMCEHGTLVVTWGWFDSTSVHWYAIYVSEYLFFRLVFGPERLAEWWVKGLFGLIFAGCCVAVGIPTWVCEGARFPFIVGLMGFLGLFLLLLAVGLRFGSPNVLRRTATWLIPAAGCGLVGIGLQLSAGPLYKSGHVLYFHAFWHVLIALTTLFIYGYLRSELIADGAAAPAG